MVKSVFLLLMVKKEFYSFIIPMDEVLAMHSSWSEVKMKHPKLYSNIKKVWERGTSNYSVVQLRKCNKYVKGSEFRMRICSLKVFRRSQDPKNFQTSLKDIPFAPLPILPPEMLTGGNKKDCIRLRNLPMECGIEQILEFLGVHSQHIVRDFFWSVYQHKFVFYRSHKVFIWFIMFMYV